LASCGSSNRGDDHLFLGLINLVRMDCFTEAGLMNEHFRSWGYEEMELHMRFRQLGYRILRTGGLAYHLGHGDAGDSGPYHPYFAANRREYHRICALNPDELRAEIAGWPWTRPWRKTDSRWRTGLSIGAKRSIYPGSN
jgi:GT2 family glycosyltransferase